MYPEKMEANGRLYKINTDYRYALACFRALNDTEISDIERFYAIETILLGEDVLPQDEAILQEKIALYLRCGQEENLNEQDIDIDYLQDEKLIAVNIRQNYNLNLNSGEYLHWYEYNDMIKYLPSDCTLNQIRDIRNTNINEIKDAKEREKLIKAKELVKLNKNPKILSQKQKNSIDEFYQLTGIERK